MEGYVSQGLIEDSMGNFGGATGVQTRQDGVNGWFLAYDHSVAANVAGNPDDPYWIHVGLVRRQLQGLWQGYNARCVELSCPGGELGWLDFVKLTPDLMDVAQAVRPQADRTNWTDLPRDRAVELSALDSHCSGLVVADPDGDDLLVGHTTWGLYSMMLRVAKTLTTHLVAPHTSAQRLSYSSYPGYLYSGDDWIVSSAGI